MYQGFVPHKGQIHANAQLNLRQGVPLLTAPIVGKVFPGQLLRVLGIGQGDSVSGNAQWYAGDNDTYFWSGGCASFEPGHQDNAVVFSSLAVHRRTDDTIRPLLNEELKSVFGSFSYTEGQKKGSIDIDPDWVKQNIVLLNTPLLAPIGHAAIKVHKKALPSFEAVLATIESAGLATRLFTCGGTFVPRHKNWDITKNISSHSWGIAIDFNSRWNGYNQIPAPIGTHGSLLELVPLFEKHGFAWGGHFSPAPKDGMHFELARFDL